MTTKVRCVVPAGDHCGEGLLWHEKEQSVYWTDINRFLVHRYSEAQDACQSWIFDEPVTTVLLTSDPKTLALVLGSGLILWRPDADERSAALFRLQDWPRVRCNDAGVDEYGCVWIGSMRNNVNADGSEGVAGGTEGLLLRLQPNLSYDTWERKLGIANTVVWSLDRQHFYLADSLANTIDRYDWDGSARQGISGRTPFLHGFERGAPDGSAIDETGCLWNCRYGGSCVVRLSPLGEVLDTIEMPVENITNCTFGGPNLKTLYITSARSNQRLSGSLFAASVSVAGMPDHSFSIANPDQFFVT